MNDAKPEVKKEAYEKPELTKEGHLKNAALGKLSQQIKTLSPKIEGCGEEVYPYSSLPELDLV